MLIESANRFGLSQLHQFRGRVGRGEVQSFCMLIPDSDTALENERLAVMEETNDGFVLAEKDLQQRGPGDFLGTRQSGFADLRMAKLTDVRLIESARRQAMTVFETDPNLEKPENQKLATALSDFWGNGKGDVS
jgi:ATP-dependent DNA helicase RecG